MVVIAVVMFAGGLLTAGVIEIAHGRSNSDCAKMVKWVVDCCR